jgi:hypothetical protein
LYFFHEQNHQFSGVRGASIITPYTVGLVGDGYWLSSTHQCNTFEYITSSGTNLGYESLSSGVRSSSRPCLIGYVNVFTPTPGPSPVPSTIPTIAPSKVPTLPTAAPTTNFPATVVPSQTPSTSSPSTKQPTTVPSFAPSMPPTLIHLTLTWSLYSSGSGGCTYSGGVLQYLNAGSLTWKNCMYAASNYGAMLFGSVYTIMPAWGGHRLNGVAQYMSQYNIYASQAISSTGTCVLARDPNAGATNNQIPAMSRTYENDVWYLKHIDYSSVWFFTQINYSNIWSFKNHAFILTLTMFDTKTTSFFILFFVLLMYYFVSALTFSVNSVT